VLRPADELSKSPARQVQRVQVRRAAVVFRDAGRDGAPALRLHDLDLALENLPTRPALAHGEPTLLAASGTLQNTGQVSLFLTADPFAKVLEFAGRAAVQDLDLRELEHLIVKETELAPKRGRIDVFAQFEAHDGRLSGVVKPLLMKAEVKDARSGLRPKLKAWVADAALRLFSDRKPGRDAVAGVIPIRGDIAAPKTDLWTTVWSVLRNAFVAGIEWGFADLPPPPQARSGPRRRGAPESRLPPRSPSRGRPPLAAAPEDLFVNGGVERIQDALAARGCLDRASAARGVIDAVTSAAVRRCQAELNLARTGVPDHETARTLGLDPDALFRRNP
jgi:hypothetical protein